MGLFMDRQVTYQINDRAEVERLYLELVDRFEKHRIEIIDGRIVVRELPTLTHARIVYRLLLQLVSVAIEQGWELLQETKIFLNSQADRYEPDLIAVPATARQWDPNHVYADATFLVVEVVSPSSIHDDHFVKPRNCARAGVPLYLVIDALENRVRLLSCPSEAGYTDEVSVKLGDPLDLPAPWNLTIDTGKLIEE
ncbi:Uma2 family endonuclease [Streptosporangium sp. NBC_01756]|uniref:Uma2 family endonuclease n=1 Tax=Streptosporangium sp. NBC_01756 TaxID=2975950 RepID=UPI002DD9B246|nr:Uma2 family endonuclease [Streptosporangium sp. NBC_01756]WSC88819.1 Uma2 family endonuclease [Streptosporangium sp. NBC_01756]